MKKSITLLIATISMISCEKNNINPKFDTRILATGTKCTISPHALGSDDHHSNSVTVDSMSWHDSQPNYFFVAVTTDDGQYFRYPDEDLIDCK